MKTTKRTLALAFNPKISPSELLRSLCFCGSQLFWHQKGGLRANQCKFRLLTAALTLHGSWIAQIFNSETLLIHPAYFQYKAFSVCLKFPWILQTISFPSGSLQPAKLVWPPLPKRFLWTLYQMDTRDKCRSVPSGVPGYEGLNESCFSFNNMLTACCMFSPMKPWVLLFVAPHSLPIYENGAGQENCFMETTARFEENISGDFHRQRSCLNRSLLFWR